MCCFFAECPRSYYEIWFARLFLRCISGIRWLAYHTPHSTAVLSSENDAIHWNNSQNVMSTSRKMMKGSIRSYDDDNWIKSESERSTVNRCEWNEFFGECVAVNRLCRYIEYRELCTERPSGQWIDVQSSINHLRLVSVAWGNALAIVRCTMQRRLCSQTGAQCAFWTVSTTWWTSRLRILTQNIHKYD